MPEITASRYHDFSCGHRVYGHESKCANLHGHNYRVHFTVRSALGVLDAVGRVLDFSCIKGALCEWLEQEWDHRMLMWANDPAAYDLLNIDQTVVIVPFNPTAENMAGFLLSHVGPLRLPPEMELCEVTIEETRKCRARATL